ncbi:MAG: prepilin-type N-terminal cleavage/methylation domain-containing protein [Planctomycetaceae bacterium]|nr:prepilin-type N-terminal cleavage/methylation domain-containing protein [Planctomycetaceae bacterium]
MYRIHRKRQGVTLIELLIVMSILIVIAGLGLPSVMRMLDRSRLTSAAKELQAELNRTRLESMKSGEPLVFHYQPGTGNYEIMAKREYDLRYPPQQPLQPFPQDFGMTSGMGMTPTDMPAFGSGSETGLSPQPAGSTAPTLAGRGSTSLVDSVAAQTSSLTDRVQAPSLADYGPPPSLTDHFAEPDLQMIAAIPVSKFLTVYKTLPHQLTFGGGQGSVASDQWLVASDQRVMSSGQNSEFGFQNPTPSFPATNPSFLAPRPSPLATRHWSEPIFFFPNGRTSNAQLSVCSTSGKGHYIDVTVRGLTGTARRGELEVLP